jgi:hypothetical protein
MKIQPRNVVVCILLCIVTFGLYGIYWAVKTKDEINSLGAQIPTAWLMIIPIVNLYFAYKYAEGFAVYVMKDKNTIMWFVLYLFLAPVAAILVQVELNKHANPTTSPAIAGTGAGAS